MSTETFLAIRNLLQERSVRFREIHHEPTATSAESARARNEDISIGGKAILLKVEGCFKLFVLSAVLKVDSARIKKHFKVKKMRFATPEELQERTGLVPGSVPPFGAPLLPFELYVDRSIAENERIAFNAGSLTDSIVMDVADYLEIAAPTVLDFSVQAEP